MSKKVTRLGIFSNQNLNPKTFWKALSPPLLESLAAYPGAQLIAPPPLTRDNLRQGPNIIKKTWSANTLFWMQLSSRPELPLSLASLLRGPVRRSAYVIDAWKPHLNKIGSLAVFQNLNPLFVAYREAYEELRKRFPRGHFEWLPLGADTRVFDAVPNDNERPIFAYWMGRRNEPLHQAMLKYCGERGLDYRYMKRPGEFPDLMELGRMVGSSRYFLVDPPNLNSPERTGGFSPLAMRYLEGLSAGARLLGVLPESGEYERLLPLPAMLIVDKSGSDLAEKLDADRNNPLARSAVEEARILVRAEHSWAKRAEQIFNRLAYGTPTGFEDR